MKSGIKTKEYFTTLLLFFLFQDILSYSGFYCRSNCEIKPDLLIQNDPIYTYIMNHFSVRMNGTNYIIMTILNIFYVLE